MATGRCASADTPTRTHRHSSTRVCQAAGSSGTQLLAKQRLKRRAKSRDPQSVTETRLCPPGTRTGRCMFFVCHFPTESTLGDRAADQTTPPAALHIWDPVAISVPSFSLFYLPPSPTQDSTMTVGKMKTSEKTMMSSSSYQTGPVALAGLNLKV